MIGSESPVDATGPRSVPSTSESGLEVIKSCLASLDSSPGVYRMLDGKGAVLYVGKARNLRNRVRSYVNPAGQSPRILRMIERTASMVFLTTRTETEALLLEQNLIKQLKPRYNVLLRDDKSFPNILVSRSHRFPQIRKHRGAKIEKGSYYGPFASAAAVNRTLNQLQKVFLLRNCSDATLESRTRPCLLHQIKRCCAPCVGKVTEGQYGELVGDAERFLDGKSTRIQKQLARDMQTASAALEFERAAALRDRIQALTQIQSVQGINPRSVPEADIIGLHIEGDQACVQVFFIRANQSWGNHAYFPRTGAGAEEGEILEAFLAQFYSNKTPAKLVLLSHPIENADLMENLLSERLGRRVAVAVPARGEKAALVENAARNAREALAMRLAEIRTQARLLEGLGERIGMETSPRRIEVYDNSHLQGANQVGAMIVVGPSGFEKAGYRKFNMKNPELRPGDDFGMMREVLGRRFLRLMKGDPDRQSAEWPDLVIIDGGKGQLSTALSALSDLGIDGLPVIGVAKGPMRNAGLEEIHLPGGRRLAIPSGDPVLYFVQRIRDEAHRFAIGAHRAKRSKSIGATPLSEIPGVGASRKSALLAHFGSAKAVARAGLADLKAVDGISDSMAETIHAFFNDG